MNPWLIIPVKPFDAAKSRLAGVLPAAQRAALSAHLLARTLRTAVTAECFAQVVVVSRDPAALLLAERDAALPLLEVGADLNAAVMQACDEAAARHASAALILPTDLPYLEPADLHRLVAAFTDHVTVVIAPSHDGGTNALLLPLPAPFAFGFGDDSFHIHRTRAIHAGCRVYTVYTPALRFDLDAPHDWTELATAAPFSVAALLADSPL